MLGELAIMFNSYFIFILFLFISKKIDDKINDKTTNKIILTIFS